MHFKIWRSWISVSLVELAEQLSCDDDDDSDGKVDDLDGDSDNVDHDSSDEDSSDANVDDLDDDSNNADHRRGGGRQVLTEQSSQLEIEEPELKELDPDRLKIHE